MKDIILQAKKRLEQGFTLIELLIVIAILAILATVVFIGIDPMARFQDTRNAKRVADVNYILSAIKLKQVDDKGLLLASLSSLSLGQAYMIGTGPGDCSAQCFGPDMTTSQACVDITDLVTNNGSRGGYMTSVPVDTSAAAPLGTEDMTGYYIIINENKTLTVGACRTEKGTNTDYPNLSVSR